MKYLRIQTTEAPIQYAVDTLSAHLRSGEQVLWLLSGGSAIELQVRIAQALKTQDTSRLTIGLIDERYGPLGQKDENYQQLMNARFPFSINRVLGDDTPQMTTEKFGQFITHSLDTTDFSLGIFGVGADGHTAGIKPHSPAVSSNDAAAYYEWDDYKRITMTPVSIRRLDEAIMYAVGSEKAQALQLLFNKDIPIDEQPAQVLKAIKTSTLYTDCALQSIN